jgi:hypothetical protein
LPTDAGKKTPGEEIASYLEFLWNLIKYSFQFLQPNF